MAWVFVYIRGETTLIQLAYRHSYTWSSVRRLYFFLPLLYTRYNVNISRLHLTTICANRPEKLFNEKRYSPKRLSVSRV